MIFIKELSLNILDIAQNSIKAKAENIGIYLTLKDNVLEIKITDDGCGMSSEVAKNVSDPFYTTRTTRNVGLGLPFFRQAAEQCGGSFSLSSVPQEKDSVNHGTVVTATFHTDNIDFTPIGDIISTIATLIQGAPSIDFHFVHTVSGRKAELDTREMRSILGSDVTLDNPDVIAWIEGFLQDQYEAISK